MGVFVDQSVQGVTEMNRGPFRTKAGRFMRTRLGRAGNNWANWGLAGVRKSFTSDSPSALKIDMDSSAS